MTVQVQRRGAVATIVLDRPDAMNAVNPELGAELLKAVQAAGTDDQVRAVVLTGAGRAFCSGADLKGGLTLGDDGLPDLGILLRERYHPIIEGLRGMPKPVIAAVNGPAVGIGLSFALSCDLVIAAESSYLLLAFVNIGRVADAVVVPDPRADRLRARGPDGAAGRADRGPQALEWGLINEVVRTPAQRSRWRTRRCLAAGRPAPTPAQAPAQRLAVRRMDAQSAGERLSGGQGVLKDVDGGGRRVVEKRPARSQDP